jgi:hypothetical protein
VIREALVEIGAKVEVHDDHFKRDEEDVSWLAEAGKRSWVVLTKDGRIRSRTLERQALKNARVHAFFVDNASRGGPAMAQTLVNAFPTILRTIASAQHPVWMTVHSDGRLTELSQREGDDESDEVATAAPTILIDTEAGIIEVPEPQ